MKKFSIVLLALLLAGGFAFAAEHEGMTLDLTGSASSSLVLDFDANTYGMDYAPSNDFSLTFSGSASSEGEGDMYGVISITDASLAYAYSDMTGGNAWTGWSASLGTLEAKIVAENWTAIFGSPTSMGNATAPDMDQNGDTASFNAVDIGLTRGEGLTIELSDMTLGVDFLYDANVPDLQYLAYANFATDLTDGVTADVTAAVNDNNVYGSVASSFAVSDLTLDVAMDMAVENDFADFGFDASVAADYAMGDMSFYTEAYYGDEDVDLLAKTSYAVEGEYSLSVWGYLSQVLTAGAGRGDVNADWGEWAVNLDAGYFINDVYDVYASTGFNAEQTVPFTVGLNAALIDNAEVNAEYASDDVSDFTNNKGALTTSVTVSL